MLTGKATGTEWLRNQAKKITEGQVLPVSEDRAAAIEVEAWLQRHDVKYAPPTQIPMALIDEKKSRGNQARKDPIVAESVERFTTAIRSGHEFPPIVVYPFAGRLVIIDGNNRQAAAKKAGKDTILGIQISDETASELIQLLTVEANAHHGVTPDVGWRIRQAFHLTSIGFTDVQAAEAAGISIQQLRNARAAAEADQRAKALKLAGFTELPQTSKGALAALKDDAVFYQAASVAVNTKMNIEEVRDLIRGVKANRSEAARIEYIGSVAKERGIEAATRKAIGRANNRISSPKQALVAGIGMLTKIDEASLIRQILTTRDRDLINLRLKALEEKLLAIQAAMETLGDLEDEEEG